jgi:hypothetical protein
MQLSQLAAKPQLIKVVLDDEEVMKEFNEAIEFYTWDRQPVETFMKLATIGQSDPKTMFTIIKTLILDEQGKEIITDEVMLPSNILLKVVGRVVDLLGK